MKSLFITVSLFIVTSVQAQTKTLVRVFDEAGNKIYKGYLIQALDSSLVLVKSKGYPLLKTLENQLDLSKNMKTYEIPITKIAIIKLRRSFGHTVLISSLVLGASFAIFGAATADPSAWLFSYTAGEGALAGFIFGAASGALTGSIIAGTRSRPVFKINRSQERWIKAKSILKSYLPVQSD